MMSYPLAPGLLIITTGREHGEEEIRWEDYTLDWGENANGKKIAIIVYVPSRVSTSAAVRPSTHSPTSGTLSSCPAVRPSYPRADRRQSVCSVLAVAHRAL
jgi:hypothetical protein